MRDFTADQRNCVYVVWVSRGCRGVDRLKRARQLTPSSSWRSSLAMWGSRSDNANAPNQSGAKCSAARRFGWRALSCSRVFPLSHVRFSSRVCWGARFTTRDMTNGNILGGEYESDHTTCYNLLEASSNNGVTFKMLEFVPETRDLQMGSTRGE